MGCPTHGWGPLTECTWQLQSLCGPQGPHAKISHRRLSAGLGLFEYMLLAEVLEAEPVWVVNAGISNMEDTPTSQIGPWIQVHPGMAVPDHIRFKHGDLPSSCNTCPERDARSCAAV